MVIYTETLVCARISIGSGGDKYSPLSFLVDFASSSDKDVMIFSAEVGDPTKFEVGGYYVLSVEKQEEADEQVAQLPRVS